MKMSKIETAMRAALDYYQAFNQHDVGAMTQVMTDDCVFESSGPAPDGVVCSGKEEIARFWQNFFRESPQAQIELEEVFGFGRRCVARWRYGWLDAAGETGNIRGVDIFRVRDDFICETFSYVKR